MQINDKPFSVYDFLGYLVPGTFSVYSFIYVYRYLSSKQFSFSIFSDNKINEEEIISIIFFYIVGHLLSFFSSMSVEKYSIWTLGYPSEYLFGNFKNRGYFSSSWGIDCEHIIGSLFRSIARIIIKFVVGIILLPIVIGDLIARKVFRLHDIYARPFEKPLMDIIKFNNKKILKVYVKKEDGDTSGDKFRLIYHHTMEHSTNHQAKMQNYIALYGFARTLTFIGCLLFWELIIMDLLVFRLFTLGYFAILFLTFFFTFFLYWDYNKFFRKFSMEAYLGAVVSVNL